jgi:hypothetical protein
VEEVLSNLCVGDEEDVQDAAWVMGERKEENQVTE